jgi:hypothetical protein
MRNLSVAFVVLSAGGLFHLNADPRVAGANPELTALGVDALEIPTLRMPTSTAAAAGAPAQTPEGLSGHWAMLMSVMLLEQGCDSFSETPYYACTFNKQERIDGELSEVETIDFRMRHEPFSVFMHWQTGDQKDQEALYVDGLYDGKLIVQPGGIRSSFVRKSLELDPEGRLAMNASRHPVYRAGILNLAKITLDYHRGFLQRGEGYRCEMRDDQELAGRPCYLFVVEHESPEYSPVYRKSFLMIDKELLIPICVRNFGWPEGEIEGDLDDATLVEFYTYTDITIEQQMADAEFDRDNESYRFR